MLYLFAARVRVSVHTQLAPHVCYFVYGGANAGDNNHFIDALGEKKNLQISNWYMTGYFGEKRLLLPCTILSTAVLTVMMCMILVGGVLV